MKTIEVKTENGRLHIAAPMPHHRYLDRWMRSKAAKDTLDVFMGAHGPAKEVTESMSALSHLLPYMRAHFERTGNAPRVLHVGDGRMCRTGVTFAFYSMADNVSVDPDINRAAMGRWMAHTGAKRVALVEGRIEDAVADGRIDLASFDFFTFVHAHVNPDWVLSKTDKWTAAFIMPCCHKGMQLSAALVPAEDDWGVLSPARTVQVLQRSALTYPDMVRMNLHATSEPSSKR